MWSLNILRNGKGIKMDNNINGDYAHLRVQQAQTQVSQVSSQSDIQPREYSAQMHDDAAAEQLGRSQLLLIIYLDNTCHIRINTAIPASG